ncbi:hypothetical protein EDB81DRAFT_808793 [Dactylonectria macrodidyma]|uniref:Uncharacterized protein n=1 Tax=Dactylonectria macrodidyma TaxID=307937 RepID=A0A9P9E3A6_9HYPO|nr:hypothetical protein EDB81DRAFT_808793 [Dactylonectria macrodidyma]
MTTYIQFEQTHWKWPCLLYSTHPRPASTSILKSSRFTLRILLFLHLIVLHHHGQPTNIASSDWKTADGRQRYESSQESEHLRTAWTSVTSSPFQTSLYCFPHHVVARQTGLSSTSDTVSVLFTFTFSHRLSSSEGIGEWDALLANFSRIIMKSPGGVVVTSSSYGWELNDDSYCVAFRYLNMETMQSFIEQSGVRQLLDGLLKCGARRIEMEFLETLFSARDGKDLLTRPRLRIREQLR